MSCFFKGYTPCKSCPYRRDAPLQHWHIDHFADLLKNDKDYMGTLYNCHQNNGSVCRGWLIDQDKRGFPSISLRMKLSKDKITREYLDELNSKVPLFDSIQEMVKANYPELITQYQSEDK